MCGDAVNNQDLYGTRCWTGVARWVYDPVYETSRSGSRYFAGFKKRGICNSLARGLMRNIGAVGTLAGCALGLAAASAPAGVVLATAACTASIGLLAASQRSGSVGAGRVGAGLQCFLGLAAANTSAGLVAASSGCLTVAGFQGLSERN